MKIDEIFIDKDKLLDKLQEEVIAQRGMYFLSGPHGIGKTYLHKRLRKIVEDEECNMYFIALELSNDKEGTLKSIMDSFPLEVVRTCVINYIAYLNKNNIPYDLKKVDPCPIVELCLKQFAKRIILVLDEFQRIQAYPELFSQLIDWYKKYNISIIFCARQKYSSSCFEDCWGQDGVTKEIKDIIEKNSAGLVGFDDKARKNYVQMYYDEKKQSCMDDSAHTLLYYYAGGHPYTITHILGDNRLYKGEILSSDNLSIPFEKIECRSDELYKQMQRETKNGKDFLQIFLQAFTNSGASDKARFRMVRYLADEGFAIRSNDNVGMNMLKVAMDSSNRLMRQTVEPLKKIMPYISYNGYEPIMPYLLEYCMEQRKAEVGNVDKKMDNLEIKIRNLLIKHLSEKYEGLDKMNEAVKFIFDGKEFFCQSSLAEDIVSKDSTAVELDVIGTLSFNDYMKIIKLHWLPNPNYFKCFSKPGECDHMFAGWTKEDAKKVIDEWDDMSEREKDKYRRVSFTRARNAFAHKKGEQEEIFSHSQLCQLEEDIDNIVYVFDTGKALENCIPIPVVSGNIVDRSIQPPTVTSEMKFWFNKKIIKGTWKDGWKGYVVQESSTGEKLFYEAKVSKTLLDSVGWTTPSGYAIKTEENVIAIGIPCRITAGVDYNNADGIKYYYAANSFDVPDLNELLVEYGTTDDTMRNMSTDTTTDATANVPTDTTTDATANVPTDTTTDATANVPTDITTDATANVPTDTTTDATANVPTDTTTDATANVPTDTTTDATANVPTDTTTDVTANVPTNTTTDVTANVPTDTTTDASANMPADTIIDATTSSSNAGVTVDIDVPDTRPIDKQILDASSMLFFVDERKEKRGKGYFWKGKIEWNGNKYNASMPWSETPQEIENPEINGPYLVKASAYNKSDDLYNVEMVKDITTDPTE